MPVPNVDIYLFLGHKLIPNLHSRRSPSNRKVPKPFWSHIVIFLISPRHTILQYNLGKFTLSRENGSYCFTKFGNANRTWEILRPHYGSFTKCISQQKIIIGKPGAIKQRGSVHQEKSLPPEIFCSTFFWTILVCLPNIFLSLVAFSI